MRRPPASGMIRPRAIGGRTPVSAVADPAPAPQPVSTHDSAASRKRLGLVLLVLFVLYMGYSSMFKSDDDDDGGGLSSSSSALGLDGGAASSSSSAALRGAKFQDDDGDGDDGEKGEDDDEEEEEGEEAPPAKTKKAPKKPAAEKKPPPVGEDDGEGDDEEEVEGKEGDSGVGEDDEGEEDEDKQSKKKKAKSSFEEEDDDEGDNDKEEEPLVVSARRGGSISFPRDPARSVQSYFANFGGNVVEIDKEGSFKYVLVRMEDSSGGSALLVRGCPKSEGTSCKHHHAFSRAKAELEGRGFVATIKGGGRITRHRSRHRAGQKEGYLSVFGYSKTFGACEDCNKLACALIKAAYPDHGVKYSNEGYLESDERKIADSSWVRC